MNNLKKYYKNQFKKYGPTLNGVGWSKKKKSTKRYKVLLKILKFKSKKKIFSILDVGCGYGKLIDYLPKNFKYNYTGIDIVQDMIEYAKKKNQSKNCNFYKKDILKITKKYDFIICNGVFTLKNNLNEKKMREFVLKCLNKFNKHSNIGFSFNLMSEIVDYKSNILFYPDKDFIINFSKKKKYSEIVFDDKSVKFEKFYFIKK